MGISMERMEKSLKFLAETDEKAAEYKADVERAAYKVKAMKAAVVSREEGAMDLRKAIAENNTQVAEATGEWLAMLQASEGLQNKRKTEVLVIDVFRTLEASRRMGNVT